MKVIQKVLLVLAMLVMVASCSKVEQKMESRIPADALVVFKADVPAAMEHLGVEVRDGKLVLPPKFSHMLNDNGFDLTGLAEETSKLAKAGIDFSKSLYCYMPADADVNTQVVLMLPVSDEAQCEAFIKDEMSLTFEEKDGIKCANAGDAVIALNDGILYCALGKKLEDMPKITAALDNDMNSNADIKRVIGAGDDFSAYVNTAKFKEQSKRMLAMVGGDEAIAAGAVLDMIDIKSTGYHLSFADGEWKYRQENNVDANSDFAKLTQQVFAAPSAELLSLMPKAANAGVIGLNLNGEGIANLEILKPYLAQAAGSAEVASMVDILKSVNGPVNLGFACETLNFNDLDVVLAFKCGKANELIGMLKAMWGPEVYTQQGDEYVMNEQVNGFKVAIGVKDGAVYLKLTHKGYTDNLASVNEAKTAVGKGFAGIYCTLGYDNMQMQLCSENDGIKSGDFSLVVTEDGKKMNPLDAIAFFVNLPDKAAGLMPN